MKSKLSIILSLTLFSVIAQVQPFNYGGEFTGTVTIKDSISVEGVINVPNATLGTHAPNLEQVQEMIEDASYQSGFKIFTFPIDVEWTTDSSKNITLSSTISETDWERTIDYTIMWNVGADATANKMKFDYEIMQRGITINTIERNSSGNLVISLSDVSETITIPAGAWIKLYFE